MMHVNTGVRTPTGHVMVFGGGISMCSCEQYHITVHGKGGHGSTPHDAIDPITAAAHIHIAMQEINSRELDPNGYGVFTTCRFEAGLTSNVIPDKAEMWGTIRTADPEGAVGEQIRTRMKEIAQGVGAAFRCKVDVEFSDFVPCMCIDGDLSDGVAGYLNELFENEVIQVNGRGGGSEDFAFISHQVPTVGMFLSTGDGGGHGLHHPEVRFDDSVLWRGSAMYAYSAMRWLEEQREK